jgi:alpha-beta hydrolase superfamily lysophospholipase
MLNMPPFEQRESLTLSLQGQKIFAVLHRPLTTEKVPGVVFCPGFAGNKCGKHRLSVVLAEALVKMGIAVLRFDYRGCGDSEGDFRHITIESKMNDVETCMQFLTQQSFIDTERLGLYGRSLGGLIAVLVAKHLKNIKNLVLWAPVFYSEPWKKLWIAYQSSTNDMKQRSVLPSFVPNIHFLEQFFSVDLEEELKHLQHVPLLHIQAGQDAIVSQEHAQRYQAARQGIENSRFIYLPQSDHDFGNVAEQKLAIEETCDWYKTTLI